MDFPIASNFQYINTILYCNGYDTAAARTTYIRILVYYNLLLSHLRQDFLLLKLYCLINKKPYLTPRSKKLFEFLRAIFFLRTIATQYKIHRNFQEPR